MVIPTAKHFEDALGLCADRKINGPGRHDDPRYWCFHCNTIATRLAQTEHNARQESATELERLKSALRAVAADGYGLQGLLEEEATEAEIANYWRSELNRCRKYAIDALAEKK